jgi:hypothetical protein
LPETDRESNEERKRLMERVKRGRKADGESEEREIYEETT